MQISVIIPTYKPQNYLWTCLDSLIKQDLSYDEFEIIIILNGPKDSYEDSILKYISNVKVPLTFKYLYSPFGNVSNARNIGMDNASGKYYCFIDDDDYVSNCYLKKLGKIACDGFTPLSNRLVVKDKSKKIMSDRISLIYKKFCSYNNVSILKVRSYFSVPCYKLVDRKIIGNKRFNINYSNGEDGLFMFLVSNKIKNIKFVDSDAIYYRRIRENSATTRKRKITNILYNNLCLSIEYSKIWIKNPLKYNFIFYISRLLALIKGTIVNIELYRFFK